MCDKLDLIIFGATGFTGKYAIHEAIKLLPTFKWGIAGRNQLKMKATLKEVEKLANQNLDHIPIIEADVEDEKSLFSMASKCRIVVNCCGPYRFFGAQVVKACVESGTHHVDISGEPQYMESIRTQFHKMAEKKKVYIVSACGFDSIPTEIGINYLENNFNGVLNSVETYLEYGDKSKSKGAALNTGTWNSAVHAVGNYHELREIESRIYKKEFPVVQPKLRNRFLIHNPGFLKGYCLPFPGVDPLMVAKSQSYLYATENKRPIQMNAYLTVQKITDIVKIAFTALIFAIFAQFSCGRKLLLKYPRIFSLGHVSPDGANVTKVENTEFKFYFYGRGWTVDEIQLGKYDDARRYPKKSILATVQATNPAYGATCVALLGAAVMILTESNRMPGTGGVLSPGAAFAKTSLVSFLSKHGYKFEVLKNDSKN